MTREDALQYRRNCPYDAMGDYGSLVSDMEYDSPHTVEEQEDTVEKIE